MPRTLTILIPDRPTEYWFTERVFDIGDTFERDGEAWVVTSVGDPDKETGKHLTVTVRRAHEVGP